MMRGFMNSGTKAYPATYYGSCITANNKAAASKDPKNSYDKCLDQYDLLGEV